MKSFADIRTLDALTEARHPLADLSPLRAAQYPGGSVLVYSRYEAEQVAAHRIAEVIRSSVADRGKAVIGLATGSTPISVYARLASMQASGELSFDEVTTYNLDEYYPMSPLDPNGYRSFMSQHLFDHVGIAPERAHLLDGTVPEAFADRYAASFDEWIEADGGLDIQLLGLGRNGHVGFNEPDEISVEVAMQLPTRLVNLHETTRHDAIKDFGDEALVPRRALTMGMKSILAARSILILAFGSHKADAVRDAIVGPMTARVPGSLLQSISPKVTWLVDPDAAAALP